MDIEKSIEILKKIRKYNKIYKEENRDLTITITLEAKESIDKAIERLLTAYENLKSYNRGTKEALKVAEELEHQANKEAGDWEARCFELKQELEKEKEKNKELEKENKKLNILRLELIISQFPDTTETYKKYKKELDGLLKEE